MTSPPTMRVVEGGGGQPGNGRESAAGSTTSPRGESRHSSPPGNGAAASGQKEPGVAHLPSSREEQAFAKGAQIGFLRGLQVGLESGDKRLTAVLEAVRKGLADSE